MSLFTSMPESSVQSGLKRKNSTAPSDSESDSESDGWDESDIEELEEALLVDIAPPKQHFGDSQLRGSIERPVWSREEREKLPVALNLSNFVETDSVMTLYRCEAAKGCNPTISNIRTLPYEEVHIFVCLMNSEQCIYMRTPDVKKDCSKKAFEFERINEGICFKPADNSEYTELRFKKKCQDKQGNQTGFELGREYESYTNGTMPQFIFIAMPYCNGYLRDRAVRSAPPGGHRERCR